MLASQLLYTGCGKDKNGVFAVWSKSSDITKSEEYEIREKMSYKRPVRLPYEPTQEQLETLFPKKFGYFYLSSGRVCLAQSVYIGRVYSDLDTRTGNYIIHAFVFDANEDIIPMNFIENDLFKRALTYEEWHEQEAPAELPKVTLSDDPAPLTMAEMKAFFDAKRIKCLKLLMQAILNAYSSDQKITFHDAHGNLKYWYKAIGACLPQSMRKQTTFCTFFTPGVSTNASVQSKSSSVNTEVKIRNIPSNVPPSIFNYQQDVRTGKYSFDFEAGLIPSNIEVSLFVHTVLDMLEEDIERASTFSDDVGAISVKCGVDLNRAMDIYYLLNGQIDAVDDFQKLKALLDYARKYYSDSLCAIADRFWTYGFASEKWVLSSEMSEISRFVFAYSQIADKNRMVHRHILSQTKFGVQMKADCKTYCQAFADAMPFERSHFLNYFFESDDFKPYFLANPSSFNSKYLLFSSFANAIKEISSDPSKKTRMNQYFIDTVGYCIREKRVNELCLLMDCFEQYGNEYGFAVLTKIISLLCKEEKNLSDLCSPEFIFDFAEACTNPEISVGLLWRLIEENEKNHGFIELYDERCKRAPSFYNTVIKSKPMNEKIRAFLNSVERYRFSVLSKVSFRELQDYLRKHLQEDSALFIKKLKEYVMDIPEKDRIQDSLCCYERFFAKKEAVDANTRVNCIRVLCDACFSVSFQTLKAFLEQEYESGRGTDCFKVMLKDIPQEYLVSNQYQAIRSGEHIKIMNRELDKLDQAAVEENKKARYNKKMIDDYRQETYSQKFEDYRKSCLKQLKVGGIYLMKSNAHDDSIENFVQSYFQDVLELYFNLLSKTDSAWIFRRLFEPIYKAPSFERLFYHSLYKMKKEKDLLIGSVILCASTNDGDFCCYLSKLADQLLGEMKRGEKKKFLLQLLDDASPALSDYISAYFDQQEKAKPSKWDHAKK